jgi:urease accessory protein UreH
VSAKWRIGRDGKLINVERFMLAPEKMELVAGKLFASEEQRMAMLGLLLENVGIDAAIELGPPELWRKAIDQIHGERK